MTLGWPAFDKPMRGNQRKKPSALSPPMNITEKMRCDSGSKQKSETLKEKKRWGETEREKERQRQALNEDGRGRKRDEETEMKGERDNKMKRL